MKKFLLTSITAAFMATSLIQFSACTDTQSGNPLLQESGLTFGTPDFSKIKTEHYLPAFEFAIQQKRDNIAKIVENKDSATFENTIVAFDESDLLLERVSRIFYAHPR